MSPKVPIPFILSQWFLGKCGTACLWFQQIVPEFCLASWLLSLRVKRDESMVAFPSIVTMLGLIFSGRSLVSVKFVSEMCSALSNSV